jgi:CubicO group peptidase (beta-lactamase class C family)
VRWGTTIIRIAVGVGCGVVAAAPAGAAVRPTVTTPNPLPKTGSELPGMSAWDTAVRQVMTREWIPGATLIVAYQGRVLLDRGYGYSNVATKTRTQPTDRFRLASVTKGLTDTAISQLIKEGKLTLNTHPFKTILGSLRGPHGDKPVDPRIDQITIKELIGHTAGWDISKIGFDPTTPTKAMYQALGLKYGPSTDFTCEDVVRYMLGQKLNNAPGTHYAYSDVGYCVLGDIVAHVMHMSYGQAMKKLVFQPQGMTSTGMAQIPLHRKYPGEVTYYGEPPYDTGTESPYAWTNPQTSGFGAFGTVSTAQDLLRWVITTSGQVTGKPWFDADKNNSGEPYPNPPGGGVDFVINGSEPGVTSVFIQWGDATIVFLGNSRNPSIGTDWDPLTHLATSMTKGSTWPTGNLWSEVVR